MGPRISLTIINAVNSRYQSRGFLEESGTGRKFKASPSLFFPTRADTGAGEAPGGSHLSIYNKKQQRKCLKVKLYADDVDYFIS